MIKKLRSSTGGKKYQVSGRELLQFQFVTPAGRTLSVSIDVGNTGIDKREYFSIEVMHDPATDLEFQRDMPQRVTLVGRLPDKETPMGIMHHSEDWEVGNTEVRVPPKNKPPER